MTSVVCARQWPPLSDKSKRDLLRTEVRVSISIHDKIYGEVNDASDKRLSCSLDLNLLVLLHVDVVVGLEGGNLVIRHLDAVVETVSVTRRRSQWEHTYVKPLMSFISCWILPPWSMAFCFALRDFSNVASRLKVAWKLTCRIQHQKHPPFS